jgi:hypothetical protein
MSWEAEGWECVRDVIAAMRQLNDSLALWALAPAVLLCGGKELLHAFVTRPIAEVPLALALYAGSFVASWTPG